MRGNYCKSVCDSRFVHSLCCSDKMNNLWFMILCVQVYVCVSVILCMCVSPFEATRACMKHSKVDGGGRLGASPKNIVYTLSCWNTEIYIFKRRKDKLKGREDSPLSPSIKPCIYMQYIHVYMYVYMYVHIHVTTFFCTLLYSIIIYRYMYIVVSVHVVYM